MSNMERIISAADRIESAAHRMALIFEDGYGGNGARLLEAMETDISALRAENARLRKALETMVRYADYGTVPENDDYAVIEARAALEVKP